MVKKCDFFNDQEKADRIKSFLREHGDKLPEEVIEQAVEGDSLSNWSLMCDDNNEIASGVTYKENDWFLCTLKNLATRPDMRRQGLAKMVTEDVIEKAKQNPSCLVLASDITFDNEGSKKTIEKFGFKEVSRFCWAKGEKPADILHYVRFPPDGTECKEP